MRFERALVTGGAGLIGSHIVDQLLQLPIRQVVVLDNFERGRLENRIRASAWWRATSVTGVSWRK